MTKNKFKNNSGAYYTRSLFLEAVRDNSRDPNKELTLFTLKDQPYEGYPSLYVLYMETEDLTEFTFANLYLDGMAHWEALCKCSWFKPYVSRWRRELLLKIKAKALNKIKEIANSDSKDSLSAAKTLLQYIPDDQKDTKGRPKKADIARAAKDQAEEDFQIRDDYNRILGKLQSSVDSGFSKVN